MADCYTAVIYILSSFFTNLRNVSISSGVSFLHFLFGCMFFSIAIRYLVKVPSSSIGGLKRSYDRKMSRKQSTPKK